MNTNPVTIPLGANIPNFLASTQGHLLAPEERASLHAYGWTDEQITEQIHRGYRCRDRSVPVVLYTWGAPGPDRTQRRWLLEHTHRISAESATRIAEEALRWEDMGLAGYRLACGATLGDHEGQDAWLVCIQPVAN